MLKAKKVASNSNAISASATSQMIVPSHDKNAALQLVGVPTATRHGCGARPFASFSGSADSCTQTKKEAPMKLPFVDFFMQLNASNSQLVSSTTY